MLIQFIFLFLLKYLKLSTEKNCLTFFSISIFERKAMYFWHDFFLQIAFLLNIAWDALGDCQNYALVNLEFYLINIIRLAFLYNKKFCLYVTCTLFRNNIFMLDEIQNARMCHIGIWNKIIQVVVLLVFHFFYFILNGFHPA